MPRVGGAILKSLNASVGVINPADSFCESDYCYVIRSGVALYYDDNHMSLSGSHLIAENLVKNFFASL
ncbi:SGNH hydrolase domain-containing protein [Aquariibacter albus]|uniref:SGNH hydrolase domain-containing protein n=1 Tax=Aquariibacter albus TaxID=2759899 RepID=UPI0038B3BD64